MAADSIFGFIFQPWSDQSEGANGKGERSSPAKVIYSNVSVEICSEIRRMEERRKRGL